MITPGILLGGLAAAESEGGGSEVEIGHHSTWHVGPLTFNTDTMTSTVIAGAVVIILGLMLRRSASSVVGCMWPGSTPVSPGSASSSLAIEAISVAWSAPGRSVRPTEP